VTRVPITPGQTAIAVVLLGGVLRLYHLTTLSLWVDEGITISVARAPWPTVLGLHGAYEVHPPLYFAFIKAVSLWLPESNAGRVVSMIAGTATIGVLYLLVARLVQPWAGVVAGLVLAVAPLHIWYSQEARQYALVVLLITTTYLALVAFVQSRSGAWALVYGVALLLSVYVEYSAVYALLPQGVLLLYLLRRHGRPIWALGAAAGGAALGFLPWLPQLLYTAGSQPNRLFFTVTPARIASSVLSLTGLAEPLSRQGSAAEATARLSGAEVGFYGLLLLAVTPAALAGARVLWRQSSLTFGSALALSAGTIITAGALSLIYPGYVKRTVLAVVLGWAALIGAAPFAAGLSRRLRALTLGSVALALLLSAGTLAATYRDGDKQHWRELAAATAQAAALGGLVITYPQVAGTLLDVYQPAIMSGPHIALDDGARLPALAALGNAPQRVWLAYLDFSGIADVRADLTTQGYVRRTHTYFPDPLYLDEYERP